jgi:hypothetical protein
MPGNDKWRQNDGPAIRLEIILAVVVVVSLVGASLLYIENSRLSSGNQMGGVTSVSTTGVNCDSDAMPLTAQQVQNDSDFVALSGNVCYNYVGENASGDATVLYFDYYNGTIVYPCGSSPRELISSQIQAVVSPSGEVTSVQMGNQSSLSVPPQCSPDAPLVGVASVESVGSLIPAVPQLNVTLVASPDALPVASLSAVLTLDGGSQQFQMVGPPSTLAPGKTVSKTEIVSNITFNADELYPMRISGTFDNGQAFNYLVHVQIAQVP